MLQNTKQIEVKLSWTWILAEKTLFMLMFLAGSIALSAQQPSSPRPLARKLMERKASHPQTIQHLFTPERTTQVIPDLHHAVSKAEFFQLNTTALSQLHSTKPELLQLPVTAADQQVILDLYRAEVFTEDYQLRTSSGVIYPRLEHVLFYRGIIHGDENSVAAVSILNDEVRVMFSSAKGNHHMHRMQDHLYVFYADRDVYQTQAYTCGVTAEHYIEGAGTSIQQRSVLTGNCVEVYFECDYKAYQDNGNSVTNTETWITALFNEVATLYENEDIPVFISDIMVWTTTDPYANLTSMSSILNEFVDQTDLNGYDGRLAHLASTRNLGGGIAYIDVLCSSTLACAVSTSLSTTVVQFPNYSWSVNVITHEMGHNFGSSHTHSCVWNGNNTQIDDCGSEAGDEQPCYNPNNPILPEDGTIMSYCHLLGGVGINFSLGFGPQPGNRIRTEYQNATCNTGTCTPPPCTELSSPLDLSTSVDVNTNISWVSVTGVDGYRITIGTAPGSGNIVNNLDVGLVTTYDPSSALPFNANIYVKIIPYNSVGNATGCTEEHFTTELNVAPACTHLTSPLHGATNVSPNADLFWAHSVGNQQGYKLTIGTTPGGGEILNLFNVGNVTTYDPGTLPASSTIYVRITPYWANGDISGCVVESFMTSEPVYCASQGLSVQDEWISGFTLGSFTNTSGAQGYSNFTNLTAHVSAGGSYPISITAGYAGQVFQEYFRVWIDSNHDGIFQNPGERVFQTGPASGTVSGTITIPVSSYIGVTRMRVSMRYSAYSTPCQIFSWGEVEDYSVQIHCNMVSNTADAGAGSLRWAVGCVASGETITFKSTLNGDTIRLENTQIIIDSPLSLQSNLSNNVWIHGLATPRIFHVNTGVNVSITGLKLIAGTAAEGSAIRNEGTLTLENTHLFKHPGISTSKLLKNSGTLTFEGNCLIE